jgi:hypothetical protein
VTHDHIRVHALVFKSIREEQDRATSHYRASLPHISPRKAAPILNNETVAGVTRGQREVLTTVDMITQCSNPDCHRELRYLRGGRVVRVIRKAGGVPEIEHFWLCEDCHRSCEFSFLPDGRVLCRGKQKHASDGAGVHRADGSRAKLSETFVH